MISSYSRRFKKIRSSYQIFEYCYNLFSCIYNCRKKIYIILEITAFTEIFDMIQNRFWQFRKKWLLIKGFSIIRLYFEFVGLGSDAFKFDNILPVA